MSLLATPVFAANETCAAAPEPVITLGFGSRYTDDSVSRSDIDEASNAQVNAALGPIDDFLRDLTRVANAALESEENRTEKADCAIAQMATWAEADAFSELNSIGANFSIGARLAGFAMTYRQVAPYSTDPQARQVIEDWLGRRIDEQMTFWEEDATSGAKTGNLRGWAALGVNLVGQIRNDPVALSWSQWSATLLQCEANPDGSLPQEMRRGKYALHYQLHAVAPMVLTTLLLEQQGRSIKGICDNALDRIVAFTIADLEAGEASEAYSGESQSLFDGTDELESFQMAWLEAYLVLSPNPDLDAYADQFRPLSHSKMGGDQALLWASPIGSDG
ncbi:MULTISPECIES: alginate lyase family protein [Rhodobacterales]|uniref:alginate lyase family protein n=1 Tax=Rhodobacterales TaxID=204455 RepID=UPI0015F09D3B|nr:MULTISPECIES: alginate lyase family protein [Rhodobacterales]MDO6591929.1 alginate lyase family protein [Yoonia sp. 1_MG-2023]